MTSGEGQADQGLQGSHPTVLVHFGVGEGASTTTGQKRWLLLCYKDKKQSHK